MENLFEYIDRKTLKLPDSKCIQLCMKEDDFCNIFKDKITWGPKQSLYKYDNGKTDIESRYLMYNDILSVSFYNNVLYMMEFAEGDNFYYENINLADKQYKKVIKSLENLGFIFEKREENTYDCKQLGLILGSPSGDDVVVSFYDDKIMNDI